jgi:hypothetical protein
LTQNFPMGAVETLAGDVEKTERKINIFIKGIGYA